MLHKLIKFSLFYNYYYSLGILSVGTNITYYIQATDGNNNVEVSSVYQFIVAASTDTQTNTGTNTNTNTGSGGSILGMDISQLLPLIIIGVIIAIIVVIILKKK